MKYFCVKNFDKFQRYKDRRPPWIRLYAELFEDYEFTLLPDEIKFHLIGIWLLASQLDNKIPFDEPWIRKKISAKSIINLKLLIKSKWISFISNCNKTIFLSRAIESAGHPETEAEAETEAYKEETEAETETEADEEKKSKLCFGEFQKVLLTQTEYEKLIKKFGDETEEKITALDIWIKSKGKEKQVKSAYATILSWESLRIKQEKNKKDISDIDDWKPKHIREAELKKNAG